MTNNPPKKLTRDELRRRLIAAKCSAKLPKGYARSRGQVNEQRFYDEIIGYGVYADAAADLMLAVADANLLDKNRNADISTIVGEVQSRMLFVMGEKSASNVSGLQIIDMNPDQEPISLEQEAEIVD